MSKSLVFSPHFDDESIGCGGTIAKKVRAGDEIAVIFMTNGKSGSALQQDITLDRGEYGELRKVEAADAMKVIGINEFECLELDEGFVYSSVQLIKQLIVMIRKYKPDIVYVPHEGEKHDDHVATNLMVMQAVHRASWTYFPHLGTLPHQVSEIRAYEVWTPLQQPNLYVDITDTISIKERAIRCYKSQILHHKHHHASLGLNRYRGLTGANVDFAEAFRVEKIKVLE